MRPTQTAVLGLACLLSAAPPAAAQPGSPGPGEGQAQNVTLQEAFAQIRRVEPVRRAGLRADLLRRTQQVVPAVVIVRNARGYLAAVSAWEGVRRFPVLWDDGTTRAAEDIARFVRAFEPETVVAFTPGDETPRWPGARDEREAALRAALARASDDGAADYNAVLNNLRSGGVASPGIVLTDVDDPAWPAALALAAARFQPIGFVQNPSTLNPPLSPDQADLLESAAQRLAIATGLEWRGHGDDIDAVTLCLNTGTRIRTGNDARDYLATTSRVGRMGANGAGERWADAGQIIGSSPQAVYRAMCGLFLTPTDAFIFDGYDRTDPWVKYSGAEAAGALRDFNFDVQLHDQPGNTTSHWLAMTARPVRQGLWLINSHGNFSVLNFPGGTVRGSDTPLLERPAIAHVVHSFSLERPSNRGSVGGAMLERGVYAMLGSVDEPFLQAFVPTPTVAKRLAAGLNFAAAVRYDNAPVWKLAVLGDPLITLGQPGDRLPEADLSLPGEADDLSERVKQTLRDRKLAAAVRTLVLLGRDADAARLAVALIDDDTAALTPDLAAAAIPALFRDGRHEHVVTAYAALSDELRAEPILADCFWFAGRFLLGSSADPERVERLMRVFPRPYARVGDAEEIAMRIRRRSVEEAVVVLESLRPKLTQQWEVEALNAAVQRVRTTRQP
jgi:hypothetical protein